MRRHPTPFSGRAATGLLLLGLVATPAAAVASASPGGPGEYRVGTAVADITPRSPQYLGGFGSMKTPTSKVHDALQVRAFVVERNQRAVAFASVDSQGWFAGYQEGPYGIRDARERIATALTRQGFSSSRPSDVIISSTHSHAAPTIMGIWGPTDVSYLRQVQDATVKAVVTAARHARPASLWTADADVGAVDGSNVYQVDIYDGWRVDGNLPLLWARDLRTGDTIGLYGNVPIHADIVNGAALRQMSADHIGMTRAQLDTSLGGTTVLAMGTLGRQESIVQVRGYRYAQLVADYVSDKIRKALLRAQPVVGSALGSAEQDVSVPASNAALGGLILANSAGTRCVPGVVCTIDRAYTPPYGAVAVVTTPVTAIRIGDLLYVSQPGEAFPEVSQAIRRSVPGARVRVVGMAQDQLGYYFPPEDAAFTTVPNDSDHLIYNVSASFADQTVAASAAGAAALGFSSAAQHPTPGVDDPLARRNPGVQFFAVSRAGRAVDFVPAYNPALDGAPLI